VMPSRHSTTSALCGSSYSKRLGVVDSAEFGVGRFRAIFLILRPSAAPRQRPDAILGAP